MGSITLSTPERIWGEILSRKDLSVTEKRLYAQVGFCQGGDGSVKLSTEWLARRLNTSRQAISRAIGGLKSAGLLTTARARFKNLKTGKVSQVNSYSIKRLKRKKFFLDLNSNQNGHSISTIMVLTYLKFRQGENDCTWYRQKTIAEDLGMGRASIHRIIAALEDDGLILVDHANGGIKQKNRYQVTAAGEAVTTCGARKESGASKRYTYSNTSSELKSPDKPLEISQENLSKKRSMLYRAFVVRPVADRLAQEHTAESIENAIKNAHCQEKRIRKRGGTFSLAAYIVGTLNAARRESHEVKLNGYAEKVQARLKFSKQGTLFDDLQPAGTDRLEHRRQLLRSQARMMLGVA